MSQKPAIRVRAADGKPREWKSLHIALGSQTFIRVYAQAGNVEFILTADSPKQLDGLRDKLAAAGVEEMVGGNTTIAATPAARPTNTQPNRQGGFQQRGGQSQRGGGQQRQQQGRSAAPATNAPDLSKKPYGFVAIPKDLTTAPSIWHDGTNNAGRLSGEIRFELETLTPLLVGWERQTLNDNEAPWEIPLRKVPRNECAAFVQGAAHATYPDATDSDTQQRQRKQQKVEQDRRRYIERVQDHIVDVQVQNAGWSIDSKTVLCPLRAPWGKRPVVIPGDSLKGLLRHELGALLGAPMERVAERSYSYRPNSMFPRDPNPFLEPRIAWVPQDGVEERLLGPSSPNGPRIRVPIRLELLPGNLRYDRQRRGQPDTYCFDPPGNEGDRYLGGQGAGEPLNSRRHLHSRMGIITSEQNELVDVPSTAQEGYLATIRHLVDLDHGHFSERHPDVPNTVTGDAARSRILKAASDEVFQPGDLIWIEWDTEKKCIVSLGWHYYYRWAYTDSVRKTGGRLERHGLFPLPVEREKNSDGAPKELSAVRRLFGYTGDNEGSEGIGEGDHSQLMGRVFVNAGLEVVNENESDAQRFLPPTFLKELGMPRPSAVEHYLKQPHHPRSRPSDNATLATYGDAAGYDDSGELAGRKFYLDRKDAIAADDSPANKQNERSTLALEASKPNRKFRFTVRFRDLDAAELAAILVALCPHQFKGALGGTHTDGYCSKLGYARPLGWGSVQIETKALLLLNEAGDAPTLKPEADLAAWVTKNHQKTTMQDEWLAIHRRNHPNAGDYPRPQQPDKNGERNIYTFHTTLRAEHSRNRRYKNGGRR